MSKASKPNKLNQPIAANGCHCGSGKAFAACCEPYLSGQALAPTAEALMRSRYSAYVCSNEAYLQNTWDERTRPREKLSHDEPTLWLGLEVRQHQSQGDQATVEFVARYKIAGKAHRLHEISRFVRHQGQWYYVDGVFPKAAK